MAQQLFVYLHNFKINLFDLKNREHSEKNISEMVSYNNNALPSTVTGVKL